ncbi:hypothetical protein LEQ41_08430 [Streptococcus agalactiae]|nr:hypothetical protein [Streptococcus agalactiae]
MNSSLTLYFCLSRSSGFLSFCFFLICHKYHISSEILVPHFLYQLMLYYSIIISTSPPIGLLFTFINYLKIYDKI